jgi:hypothetical protein
MPPNKRTSVGTQGRNVRGRGGQLTLDQQVSRAIYDNFRDWSTERIYVDKVNGKTLDETIRAKKKDAMDKGETVGASFYAKLKKDFIAEGDPMALLAAKDPKQSVRPELMKAMIAGKRQHPERTGLQSFFVSSATPPNQMEAVGVFKYFLGLKPTCQQQTSLGTDFLRWVARLGVDRLFPEEWALLKTAADRLLLQAWKRARDEEKMEAQTFTQLHIRIFKTIIPEKALDMILACKGEWATVSEALHAVVGSSDIGLSLSASLWV